MESALRLMAVVSASLVLISFGLFARDQFSGASENQQHEIVAGMPHVPGVAPQAARHGQPRRFIDGAARKLESPFESITASSNAWVRHSVPAVVAVLLYGFGIGFVARYAHGRP